MDVEYIYVDFFNRGKIVVKFGSYFPCNLLVRLFIKVGGDGIKEGEGGSLF